MVCDFAGVFEVHAEVGASCLGGGGGDVCGIYTVTGHDYSILFYSVEMNLISVCVRWMNIYGYKCLNHMCVVYLHMYLFVAFDVDWCSPSNRIIAVQCSAVHRWINEWMDVSFISLSTRYVCAVVSNYSSID